MEKLSDEKISEIWDLILEHYNKYLKEYGVKIPKLKNGDEYTNGALVLVKLAENYPNTKPISKKDLTIFMRLYKPDITDVQQARHLSMQSGWNIKSGFRGNSGVKKYEYHLINMTEKYPAFRSDRRTGFHGDWESIKNEYNNCCATCGSKEGKSHLFRKDCIVKLQKGHMDPSLPLEESNIIPQCQICNRADKDKWIYDKTGRVIEVANTLDGEKIIKKYIKKKMKTTNKKQMIKDLFDK